MRKWLIPGILLVAAVAVWFLVFNKKEKNPEPKPQPIAVSDYGADFDASISEMLQSYYDMTEAFVHWDTNSVSSEASEFQQRLVAINLEPVKKDTAIHENAAMFIDNAKAVLANMMDSPDLTSKRRALNTISDHLYNFLRVVKYGQKKVYWQECPMAFNDTESGFWLSDSAAIRNPYLGMHDPKYGSGMLRCGETRDSLDFTPAE